MGRSQTTAWPKLQEVFSLSASRRTPKLMDVHDIFRRGKDDEVGIPVGIVDRDHRNTFIIPEYVPNDVNRIPDGGDGSSCSGNQNVNIQLQHKTFSLDFGEELQCLGGGLCSPSRVTIFSGL